MMGASTAEIEVVGKLEADGLALTHARWRSARCRATARSSRAASRTAAG